MDLLISVDRAMGRPLRDQLYDGLRGAILDGRLTTGARLPATGVRLPAWAAGVGRLPAGALAPAAGTGGAADLARQPRLRAERRAPGAADGDRRLSRAVARRALRARADRHHERDAPGARPPD